MSPHVDNDLSAYLDDELDGLTRKRIGAHLDGCDRCSARLAELAALDDLSREVEIEAPNGYFEALPGRVRNRLRDRAAPRWVVPRWTWAAAAAALIAVLAPLTIQQGPDITPEPARFSRPAASLPTAPPASLARQGDPQESLRQVQALNEVIAGDAGDSKSELRAEESFAVGRKDVLESKSVAAAPTAPPPERAANRPASKPKAKERSVAARKRSPAATPAPAASSPGEPLGFAAAALDVPTESDDVGQPAAALEEEGGEMRDQDALMRTSGKVARQGRRENVDVRGAVGGLTTAEALRAPADADALARLRLERDRLRLDKRDQADVDATGTRQVRIIELGVRIYQLSRDANDLSAVQEDIRRYLAVPDAPQADRVRELERELAGR